jgi:hypothetical protein
MNYKSIFTALLFSVSLSLTAFAGNNELRINVPTSVSVEDIKMEFDMPKSMRTGNTSKDGVNTLAIQGFEIKPSTDGRFSLAFNLPSDNTSYVRIVDAAGYDVYFETVKGNASFSKQIDLSTLAAGTYYLQVTQKGKTYNKRLIFN